MINNDSTKNQTLTANNEFDTDSSIATQKSKTLYDKTFSKKECYTQLYYFPVSLPLTPVQNKIPYRHAWQKETPVARDVIESEIAIGKATGYGLRTGEVIKGTGHIAIDVDGETAQIILNTFEKAFGTLPNTVCWTSNKFGRYQLLFKIPEKFLECYSSYTRRAIKTGENEQLEFRYNTFQSVLPPSKHPETGKYDWVNSIFNTDIAYLPDDWCSFILSEKREQKTKNNSKPFERKKTNKKINGFVGKNAISDLIDDVEKRLTFDEKFYWSGHNFNRKNDNEVWGYCPVHGGESGTAFQVNSATHQFYCHNCQKGGSYLQYIAFVETGDTTVEGTYFWKVLKQKADSVGIKIEDYVTQKIEQTSSFTPDKTIHVSFISESEKLKSDTNKGIALKSSKKTGKTTYCRDLSNNEQIGYICCRDSVTRNFVDNSNALHINDIQRVDNNSFAVNADSINKIPYIITPKKLIIDEAELVLKHLITGKTEIKNRRKVVINRLIELAQNAEQVILLDAFLTNSTVDFYERLLGIKFTKYENTKKKKLKSLEIVQSSKEIENLIFNEAENNNKTFIILDSKKEAKILERELSTFGKTLLLTSETKNNFPKFLENPTKYIEQNQIQFLIATNCIGVGFSIENYNYFNSVLASFPNGNYDSKEIGQFLFRLRDFDVTRFMYLGKKKNYLQIKDYQEIKNSILSNDLITDQEKEEIEDNIERDLNSKLYDGLILIDSEQRIEGMDYRQSVLSVLREYVEEKILETEKSNKPQTKINKAKTKKELQQEECELIFNANDNAYKFMCDDEFYSIKNKTYGWYKHLYKKLIPQIDCCENWTIETIHQLHFEGLYKKVKKYFYLTNYDYFINKEAKRIKHNFIEHDKFYADYHTNEPLITMLRDIGILDLIKKGFYYRDNDPDVLIIKDKLDNHISKHLFYGRKHGNDFNKILNSVFKSLGITVKRGKKCQMPCYKLIKSELFTLTYDAIHSRFGADGADVAIKDTKRITARTAPAKSENVTNDSDTLTNTELDNLPDYQTPTRPLPDDKTPMYTDFTRLTTSTRPDKAESDENKKNKKQETKVEYTAPYELYKDSPRYKAIQTILNSCDHWKKDDLEQTEMSELTKLAERASAIKDILDVSETYSKSELWKKDDDELADITTDVGLF